MYGIAGVGILISVAAVPIGYYARGKTWAGSLLGWFALLALLPTYAAVSGFVAFFNEGFQLAHILLALAWLVPGIAVWCAIHLWRMKGSP